MKHLTLLLALSYAAAAQQAEPVSKAKTIENQIKTLRSLDDTTRARVTRQLADEIRSIPTKEQLTLASNLVSRSTEGDFGRDTLQSVTTTLEAALRAFPPSPTKDGPAYSYFQIAQLARYENMTVNLKDPQYAAALKQLKTDDDARQDADFTLTDLNGTKWTLKSLRGKIVLVNFWATWCPPCLKEMPDLNAIYQRFKDRGLVILAISDEEAKVVEPFIATKQKVTYPVLLDPGGKVTKQFRVDGIPKTFIYGREGKLAAQSIDMRTMEQFLALLKQAGLK
jgi:peroxiredoxin